MNVRNTTLLYLRKVTEARLELSSRNSGAARETYAAKASPSSYSDCFSQRISWEQLSSSSDRSCRHQRPVSEYRAATEIVVDWISAIWVMVTVTVCSPVGKVELRGTADRETKKGGCQTFRWLASETCSGIQYDRKFDL